MMLQKVVACYHDVADGIAQLNARLGEGKIILTGSENGFLATFSLSPELLDKAGIRNSEALQEYLLATTGIYMQPLKIMGMDAPTVRINLMQAAPSMDRIMSRLEALVNALEEGQAPPLVPIRKAFEGLEKRYTMQQTNQGRS